MHFIKTGRDFIVENWFYQNPISTYVCELMNNADRQICEKHLCAVVHLVCTMLYVTLEAGEQRPLTPKNALFLVF